MKKTTEAARTTVHSQHRHALCCWHLPPATKHPSTLQSSASELPQVDSCALLPSLSFWGSAKSDCLGRKSSSEAQLCRSSSAETQIPADVNEASGGMLMSAFFCKFLNTWFIACQFQRKWNGLVCEWRFLVNMQAYVLHPPAAVLQLNHRPRFITQIRTQSVHKRRQ